MKRFMALVCAGVLACSMGLTAFAAQSPSTPDVDKEVVDKIEEEIKDKVEISDKTDDVKVSTDTVKVTDPDTGKEVTVGGDEIVYTDTDGKEVKVNVSEVKISAVSETVKTSAASVAKTAAAKIIARTEGLESKNAKVTVNVMEVSFPANVKEVIMPFSLPQVKAGDKVVILHQLADGTWEEINPISVVDGKVIAKFKSFSPIAFVTVSNTAATDNNDDDDDDDNSNDAAETPAPAADGSVKSPKTGDAAVPFMVVFAIAAVAGVCVAGKKAAN